jgi:hypothetical protein
MAKPKLNIANVQTVEEFDQVIAATLNGPANNAPPKPKPIPSAELPLAIEHLSRSLAAEAISLLEEALLLEEQIDALDERLKQAKARLAMLAREGGMPQGTRWEQMAVRVGRQSRKHLDKGILMLKGCPPAALAAAMVPGAEFDVVEVIDLTRPRKKKTWEADSGEDEGEEEK